MIDVQKAIQVHVVTDGKETKGWVHTHGMAKHGKPELEIRGVPLFLAEDATRFINQVADYFLNGDKPVRLGESMQLGSAMRTVVFAKGEPIPGEEATHEGERWLITSDPRLEGTCEAHGFEKR
jgi:hypothetical protein